MNINREKVLLDKFKDNELSKSEALELKNALIEKYKFAKNNGDENTMFIIGLALMMLSLQFKNKEVDKND